MPHRLEHKSRNDSILNGELIKLREAADKTGFSVGYLRTIAQSGRLDARKINRGWYTTLDAVEEYKNSRLQIKVVD